MEKPKFKVNDFLNGIGSGDSRITVFDAVDLGNAYLDKLFKDAVRVYGHCDNTVWGNEKHGATHKAVLIGIEEIEPKTCDHKIVVIAEGINGPLENVVWGCGKCGKKLKAKWEPVDE
jgi:hypothetical protein